MRLQKLTPMLRTKNLEETVEFYVKVLGFDCAAVSDEWRWASVTRDAVTLMFSLPNAHEPFDKPAFTGSLYFRSNDVDAAWEQLKEKVRICYPNENFEYGMREFAFYDNNGYLLQFGQEIPDDQALSGETP